VPSPLFVDLGLAVAAALVTLLVAAWASASPSVPAAPTLAPAREVGEVIRSHRRLRRLLTRRLDRSVATGFLLTLAVAFAVAAGVVLGVLAYLVRSFPPLKRLDRSVAAWGYDHRTPLSHHGLEVITQLGNIEIVAVVAVVLAAVDLVRSRNRRAGPFLLAVLAGMELISTGVKDLVDRTRPAFVAQAAHLGPSFPSGHSATAAAFYAAAALVLARRLRLRKRHVLAAVAAGLAVAVAVSRVLLDLHWLSDVVGGLALGWGWFALCAVIFGGRLLRPTAAVETASASAEGAGTTFAPAPRRTAGKDVSYEACQPAPPWP
jgi:undecaprenyl-diphosphatase